MRPIEELRYLILAAQREGSRMFAAIMRPLGLTPSQSEVLRVLQDHAPISLVELGELLVCETSSPSRLVNRLVEAGLVRQEKSKKDTRKVTLTLTKKGYEVVAKVVAAEDEIYASLSPMLDGAPVAEIKDLLWQLVEGKPAGVALSLRKASKSNDMSSDKSRAGKGGKNV